MFLSMKQCMSQLSLISAKVRQVSPIIWFRFASTGHSESATTNAAIAHSIVLRTFAQFTGTKIGVSEHTTTWRAPRVKAT